MRKKKSFIALTVVLSLCMILSSGIASASVQPLRDNNYGLIDNNFIISETGYATVEAFVYGVEGETEKIRTEIQIKKQGFLGLFWNVVDIGVAGNIWMDDSFYNSHVIRSVQLDSEGTYKACFKFTIRDFGGESETLSREIQREY